MRSEEPDRFKEIVLARRRLRENKTFATYLNTSLQDEQSLQEEDNHFCDIILDQLDLLEEKAPTLGLAFLETCWDRYKSKDRKEEMVTQIVKKVVVGGGKDMERFLRWRDRVARAKDGNLELDWLNAISYRGQSECEVQAVQLMINIFA